MDVTCRVACDPVSLDQIFTHWSGWEKCTDGLTSYELTVSHKCIISKFGDYWTDFIDRERLEDGSPSVGHYAELKRLGYPSLADMLILHSSLLQSLILDSMKPEFLGYVVQMPQKDGSNKRRGYFLQSLDNLNIGKADVKIMGTAIKYDLTQQCSGLSSFPADF